MESSLGARVRSLRERARMQSRELAVQLGIDPSAMSNIESGKRAVKTSELMRIAEVLAVSPMTLLDEGSLPARMQGASPDSDDAPSSSSDAYARLTALSELHTVLHQADISTANYLGDVPHRDQGSWTEVARRLASWSTNELHFEGHGTTRFDDLADAIQMRFHVDVLVERHPEDPMSGAAITDRAFPLIFVNASSPAPAPSALFTLAHELGHLLIRHESSLMVDNDLAGTTRDERQANAFAAELLMPEERINKYMAAYRLGPESLARMIHEFGVTFDSLVFRLRTLRKISAEDHDSLLAIGWEGLLGVIAGSDLHDSLGSQVTLQLITHLDRKPAERPPTWLARRSLIGYQRGVISVRPLAGLLHLDPDELLDRTQRNDEFSAKALERIAELTSQELIDDDVLFCGNPVSENNSLTK